MSTVYDVAVVGSRGFLGSAIAAELERRGAHVGRFTTDSPYVVDGALAADARAVLWAAAYVTPADARRGDDAIRDLQRLVDAAQRLDSRPHIALISSGGAVYGAPSSAPFAETDVPVPANEYGRIKLAEEHLLARADMPHTVLRIANPYGPGQVRGNSAQGVIGAWMRAVLAGEPVTLFGDGSVIRDYVYIDDAAAAVAAALEREPHGVINVGSGAGTTLADLLGVVSEAVAPREVDVRREPARGIDPPANWLNVSRARDELGWHATTTLPDGVARTWAAVSP